MFNDHIDELVYENRVDPLFKDNNMTKSNILKDYESFEVLREEVDPEVILGWVNSYVEVVEARRLYGKRHRTKQAMFAKLAEKMLDPDELDEIRRKVEDSL